MYTVSRDQIRAARALLGWSQPDLAEKASLSVNEVGNYENGRSKTFDTYESIVHCFENHGIQFIEDNGVRLLKNHLRVIKGSDCYLRLLDEAHEFLNYSEDKNLYIMCASDKASSDAVNEKYRKMRASGIKMFQIIAENDTYIMGKFEEYRCVSDDYFTNVVTLIYNKNIAQVNGDETRITIQFDEKLAEQQRNIFRFFWDNGKMPEVTTAKEVF